MGRQEHPDPQLVRRTKQLQAEGMSPLKAVETARREIALAGTDRNGLPAAIRLPR